MPRELKIVNDLSALHHAGAAEFLRCARESIAARGVFTTALSGGSTPQGTYALLAKEDLPWEKIHIFFGDERHVPPDDPQSNFRMANESLLSKIKIPEGNVHRIRAELPANEAAAQYEQDMRQFFRLPQGEFPRFDLIFLGIGEEGHTASLFPDSNALNENSRWVVENWVEKLNTWRITFTFPVLNQGAKVLFLITGDQKAAVIKEVVEGPKPEAYPCGRVQPVNGRLLWYVTAGAARLLKR